MAYLEGIADLNTELKSGFTPNRWDKRDAEWLLEQINIAGAALGMKGRLVDAPRNRKALDKRLARKSIWALREPAKLAGVAEGYLKEGGGHTSEQKRQGAQIEWDQFCTEAAAWLDQRSAHLAAYAIRGKGFRDVWRGWANKKCYKYGQAASELRRIGAEWD